MPVRREVRRGASPGCGPSLNTYGRGPGQRDPLRHRRTRTRRSSSSRWPTAATTPGRSTTSPGSSSGASWSPPPPATCRAASRSAARCSSGSLSRLAGPVAALVRPGRHPRRHQLVQGLRPTDFVREVGIESDTGFEIGLELSPRPAGSGCRSPRSRRSGSTAPSGVSNFQLRPWLPQYLRWYRFAFGRAADARAGRRRRPRIRVARHRAGGTHAVARSWSPARPASSAATSSRSCSRRGHEVVGIDNYSKYGQVAKSYDDHPRLPPRRGRRPRRRPDDRAARRTATTSSPAPR